MSTAAEWAIRRFVEVGPGIAVEMTAGPRGMCCEWIPDKPHRPLTKQEIRNYRVGRDTLLGEVAQRMGGNVLVVEI
jgi:hypothetical protein